MKKSHKLLTTLLFILVLSTSGLAQTDSKNSEASNNASVIQLSDTVKITEFNFDGLDVTIIFEADIPQMISLVDQNSFEDSGAGKPNVKITQLSAGKNEVQMRLEAGRQDTIFISQGIEGFATISDRGRPLLTEAFLRDLPIVGLMSVLCAFGQFFLRRWWDRLRLGWGIRWEG